MMYKRSEIVINFKQLPHNIFTESFQQLPANKLIIHLQPNEGIEIQMLKKYPVSMKILNYKEQNWI